MDASKMQELMSLYAAGKVPEDYFRSAIASYRQSAFVEETTPTQNYYKSMAIQYGSRAKEYDQEVESYRQQLIEHVRGLTRQLNESVSNPYYKQQNQARAWEKLKKLVSRSGIRKEEYDAVYAGVQGRKTKEKRYRYVLDEENIVFKSAEDIVKASTSRRGNLVTPWGQLAVDYGSAIMSYEDYDRRRGEMRTKYSEQRDLDRQMQESRFTTKKSEILESAEKMFGSPRERVYTERSL